jgi:competence protein ComEA
MRKPPANSTLPTQWIDENEAIETLPASVSTSAKSPWWLLLILLLPVVYFIGAGSRSSHPPAQGPFPAQVHAPQTSGSSQTSGSPRSTEVSSNASLLVHVAGAVQKPGVYEFAPNARVREAITKAKPRPDADVNALNLAAYLEDGQRIEVPQQEISDIAARHSGPQSTLMTAPEKPTRKAATRRASERPQATRNTGIREAKAEARSSATARKAPSRPVDLNRASQQELETLPGVGPALAQRIIDYREEHNGFASADELDEVKGIGEKKLEKIRPFVVVR